MFNRIKIICLLTATIFALSAVLMGCGQAGKEVQSANDEQTVEQSKEESLPPVELSWYFGADPNAMKDMDSVVTEMNKILTEKINATIKLHPIEWAKYADKTQVMLAANESFDLMYTSSWINYYSQNVAKGAFLALDDLLDKYGKTMKSAIPQKYWDAIKISGKTYAVLNYQNFTNINGFSVRKDLLDKYKFDLSTVKELEDIEPFLEMVKNGENGITPYLSADIPKMDFNTGARYLSLTSSTTFPAQIRSDDKEFKIVNLFETPEAKSFYALMRDWYQKGYIGKDAAVAYNNRVADLKAGKYAVMAATAIKPGNEAELAGKYGGQWQDIAITEPYVYTFNILGTMTAVSASSKNADRAVMFYDLLFSDKELYNLLCFGIESKHYKKISDKSVEVISDAGYAPTVNWEFGNSFNAYYIKGQEEGIWDETVQLMNEAEVSPLIGFTYDASQVKTETANVNSVISEYLTILFTGSDDPEKILTEMNTKLKSAGLENIIADGQKQIDEWKKSK